MRDAENRLRIQAIDVSGLEIEHLEFFGARLVAWQRGINWWLGDVAVAAEAIHPEGWEQCFPVDVSPGLILRCKAIAKAYPESNRNPSR